MAARRDSFLTWCLLQLNDPVPYVWGGKDPRLVPGKAWRHGGLDCSGFVTYGLSILGGPEWRASHNTDRLWTELPRVDRPLPGDLVLYRGAASLGPDDVEHVMVYVGSGGDFVRGLVVGQAYGGARDVDPQTSRMGGKVTKVFSLLYRKGFAGFVRPPFDGE